MQQRQQIIEKCRQVMALAEQLFNVDMQGVDIRFDLKGRAAGMACRRGGHYYMRFNHDMLTREAFEHVLNNTVPHEVAHIVCFKNPNLGRNHDYGWARVCRQLGGTGDRTHSEEVVYGKGYTYEYTTDRGHKVRVGDNHHKKIQMGVVFTWRGGKGKADRFCEYSIVGYQGRTLPQPRHFPAKPRPDAAPNLPARLEELIRKPVTLHIDDRTGLGLFGNQKTITVPAFTPPPAPAPQPVSVARAPVPGESKAAISRRIMLSGYRAGESYEAIIQAMIAANGYDRQLARATFKANAAKVGIPESFIP